MEFADIYQSDLEALEELPHRDYAVTESFESLIRLLDTQSALIVLRDTHSSLDSASFEAAARPVLLAACAGTAYGDDVGEVSLESIKSLISNGFKAIVEAIKRFFTHLIEFLATLDLGSLKLQRNLVVIERKASAYRGKKATQDVVTLGRLSRYLRIGRVYADDSLKLEHALKELSRVVTISNKDLVNTLLTSAEQIPTAARGKQGTELDQALTALVASMNLEQLAAQYGMGAAPAGRFNRTNVLTTPPLLGGKSLFFMKGKLSEKGTRAFRFHGFIIEDSTEDRLPIDETRPFRTLAPTELNNLPGLTRDLLNQVSRGAGMTTRSRISRTRNTLENYLRNAGTEGMTQQDVDTVRRTVSAYTYWLHNVTRPLNGLTLSVCRGVISYCNASIETYR